MAKTFHLTIARIGEEAFAGEVVSVSLPGSEGVFTVLGGHEPLVTTLVPGVAKVVRADAVTEEVTLEGTGVAEVSGEQVTVLL